MTVHLYTALIELDRKLIKLVTGIFFILDLLPYLYTLRTIALCWKIELSLAQRDASASAVVYSRERMLAV